MPSYRARPPSGAAPETAGPNMPLGADTLCPFVPGPVRRLHWPIADPTAAGDIAAFRTAPDRIKARIDLPDGPASTAPTT